MPLLFALHYWRAILTVIACATMLFVIAKRVVKSSEFGAIMNALPHPGDKIHILLKTDEALRLALQVKPTKDMPRPGAQATKAKKTTKKRRAQ